MGSRLVTGRGLVRMWVDDLVAAREDLASVVEGARPGLASARGLIALGWLSECEYRMASGTASALHGALAVSLAADTDQHWLTAFVRAQACWVAAARGHWHLAEGYVGHARAAASASASGDAAGVGYAAIAEAHLAFCRGQPGRVVEAVQPFLRRGEWQAVRGTGCAAVARALRRRPHRLTAAGGGGGRAGGARPARRRRPPPVHGRPGGAGPRRARGGEG